MTVSGVAGLSKVDVKKVTGYEGLVKGDYVMWHKNTAGDYFLTKCESMTGKLTDTDNYTKLFIDGTAVKVSEINAAQTLPAAKAEGWGADNCTYYLDKGGYVAKVVADETAVNLDNTLYVMSKTDAGYAEQAKVLFANGTSQVITVNKVGSTTVDADDNSALDEKTFYTFEKQDNGSYNLKAITNAQAALTANDNATDNAKTVTGGVYSLTLTNVADLGYTITKNASNFLTNWTYNTNTHSAPANVLATAKTAFVYDTATGYTVYEGISKAPSYAVKDDNDVIAYLCDSNGYAIFVVAYGGDKDNTAISTDFVVAFNTAKETYVSSTETYYTYDAVVNGNITTIEAKNDVTALGELTSVATYDGARVASVDSHARILGDIQYVDKIALSGYTMKFTNNGAMVGSIVVDESTKYFIYDSTADDKMVASTADELTALVGNEYTIQVLVKSTSDNTAAQVFVTKGVNNDTVANFSFKNAAGTAVACASTSTSTFTLGSSTTDCYTAVSNAVGNGAVTVKIAADPNAVLYYVVDNDGVVAASDFTACTGTVVVTVPTTGGADDQVVYFKVVNNGSTAYYEVTLDEA